MFWPSSKQRAWPLLPKLSARILIRRASLDITGLPPSIAEIENFINDASPNAYEKVVDRLLDSPHYGERWARLWLDLARYADTDGYEKDPSRSMWPYRDWVIDALNRNIPFDQFTIEQIAGDLLPNATLDQRVATGFHRNTMINTEGGTDDEEFRVAAVIDRVNTTATVWLGTTLGCTQCHSHKYDPFRQKEYYQLFAFLNGTADPGRTDGPKIDVPPRFMAGVQKEIAQVEAELNTTTAEVAAAQASWEQTVEREYVRWTRLDEVEFASEEGATATKQDDGFWIVAGNSPDKDTYTLSAGTSLKKVTGLRIELLPDETCRPRVPAGLETEIWSLVKCAFCAGRVPESKRPWHCKMHPPIFTRKAFCPKAPSTTIPRPAGPSLRSLAKLTRQPGSSKTTCNWTSRSRVAMAS